jgi:hypothetical protein
MVRPMKLSFETFDGRKRNDLDILDEVGRKMGWIASRTRRNRYEANIHINLFDGKYTNSVHTIKDCRGFVEGVEKVLNHVM